MVDTNKYVIKTLIFFLWQATYSWKKISFENVSL